MTNETLKARIELLEELRELERDLEANEMDANRTAWGADVVRRVLFAISEAQPLPRGEREHLHDLLGAAHAVIDVEQHPDVAKRIEAVLLPCDDAGHCVPLQARPASPSGTQE